jgi:MoxR-like ATPase
VREVYADRRVMAYAVQLADATRHPGRYGLQHLEAAIEVGASPRGPIGLVQAGQALALLRGRTHVTVKDIRDLAPDVLRHRLVLSYDAHADGIDSEDIVSEVLGAVQAPGSGPEAA